MRSKNILAISRREFIRFAGIAGSTGLLLLIPKRGMRRANTYYVSNTGSNSNPGTIDRPWKTIARVNAAILFPGDQVLFRCGETFAGRLIPRNSGDDSRDIIYGAYGTGNRPIIDGSASNALYIYPPNTNHYLRFENIVFSGAYNPTSGAMMAVARVYTHDIYFYNCDFCNNTGKFGYLGAGGFSEEVYNQIYDHCNFYNNGRSGLYLGSPIGINAPRNCLIVDCTAHENGLTGRGHGLYVEHGTHVVRLHSYNNGAAPSYANSGIKFSNLYNTDCVYTPILEDSYIHNNVSTGLYIECNGAIVKNNLFVGNHGSNMVIVNSLASELTTSDDSIVVFNTFINCPNQEGIYWEYPDGHGVIFKNNVIIQDNVVVPSRYLMNCGNGGKMEDIQDNNTFDYNVYYYNGNISARFANSSGGPKTFTQWKAMSDSPDAHSTLLTSMPGFVTRYTDMHPAEGSNLKGLGVTVAGYELDKDGNTRADPPTPGCYE